MVPTHFSRLLALPDAVKHKHDLSSLRHVIHSAAPCPVEVKRRMLEWWGPNIFEYYAASEGGGTLATPDDWLRKPGTVGKPWPLSTIRIHDDAGAAQDSAQHRLRGGLAARPQWQALQAQAAGPVLARPRSPDLTHHRHSPRRDRGCDHGVLSVCRDADVGA